VNEIIRESPDQIALKISRMNQLIEEQRSQIATRDYQIHQFEQQAKQFASVGPMKAHLELLEQQVI
jgi:hypothetical protein